MSGLKIDGTVFRDNYNRMVLLRGVNLGGDCKVPASPDRRTHLPDDFSDHKTVSFVGRPFPLEMANEHFQRLAHWGFNCLRLLTTWEAVEHAGPGIYDEEYLDYLCAISRLAGEFGFYVFIDMHQDVWSRMSGGDGAPGWTFEAAGLDFTKFDASESAHVMQYRYDTALGGIQSNYPIMSWGRNYRAPANSIMWTLFFAGRDFAPSLCVDGKNIQNYLQDHYLGSMSQIAMRIADQPHVMGFDTLNEPGEGWIGRPLEKVLKADEGPRWSPLTALAVASGIPTAIDHAKSSDPILVSKLINPNGVSIWLSGRADPFKANGAWDTDSNGQAIALQPDYFCTREGSSAQSVSGYMEEFFRNVAGTVQSVRPDWLIFAEMSPFSSVYRDGFPKNMPAQTVNASHWYDLDALLSKKFKLDDEHQGAATVVRNAVEERYVESLRLIQNIGNNVNDGVPTLIGECGYQFDMNEGQSYERYAKGERGPDVWKHQTQALEIMYNAFDHLLLNSTLWNYTATNQNDVMIGDGWNQEDLSIFSLDQLATGGDPDSGGRAIEGFCRPYVRCSQGRLQSQNYNRRQGVFAVEIDIDIAIGAPTEIYIPRRIFGSDPRHVITSGAAKVTQNGQFFHLNGAAPGLLTLQIFATSIHD